MRIARQYGRKKRTGFRASNPYCVSPSANSAVYMTPQLLKEWRARGGEVQEIDKALSPFLSGLERPKEGR